VGEGGRRKGREGEEHPSTTYVFCVVSMSKTSVLLAPALQRLVLRLAGLCPLCVLPFLSCTYVSPLISRVCHGSVRDGEGRAPPSSA